MSTRRFRTENALRQTASSGIAGTPVLALETTSGGISSLRVDAEEVEGFLAHASERVEVLFQLTAATPPRMGVLVEPVQASLYLAGDVEAVIYIGRLAHVLLFLIVENSAGTIVELMQSKIRACVSQGSDIDVIIRAIRDECDLAVRRDAQRRLTSLSAASLTLAAQQGDENSIAQLSRLLIDERYRARRLIHFAAIQRDDESLNHLERLVADVDALLSAVNLSSLAQLVRIGNEAAGTERAVLADAAARRDEREDDRRRDDIDRSRRDRKLARFVALLAMPTLWFGYCGANFSGLLTWWVVLGCGVVVSALSWLVASRMLGEGSE